MPPNQRSNSNDAVNQLSRSKIIVVSITIAVEDPIWQLPCQIQGGSLQRSLSKLPLLEDVTSFVFNFVIISIR